jgi:acetylornithine deacetylase/succinyl-diaminopimelate desuccinylase family protein
VQKFVSELYLSTGGINMLHSAITEAVEPTEVIRLLSDLVKIPSVNPDPNPKTGSEEPVARLLGERLQSLGFDVIYLEAQPGRPNVVAILEGEQKVPTLWFNGHMDVLPVGRGWKMDPFGAEIIDGKLYGRGSNDMKAGLTAMVIAASTIIRKGIKLRGTLVLNPVVDEVSGGLQGTGFVVKEYLMKGRLPRPDMAVICEPTKNQVRIAHRGIVWMTLETSGQSAHGGRPWLGDSAISRMAKVIAYLEHDLPPVLSKKKHSTLLSPNFNIGVIRGGTKVNLVPDSCAIDIDRRTLPGETAEEVLGEIREVLNSRFSEDELRSYPIELSKILDCEATEISPSERIVKECERAYEAVYSQSPRLGFTAGFEDAHWFINDAKIPTAMFGPYIPGGWSERDEENSSVPGQYTSSGKPYENVDVQSVINASKCYIELMLNILA